MKAILSFRTQSLWWTAGRPEREMVLERAAFLAEHHVRPMVSSPRSADEALAIFELLRKRFGFKWMGMEGLSGDFHTVYQQVVADGWADGFFYNVADEPHGNKAVPSYRQFKKLRIESDTPVPSQVDGDMGPNTPLDIEVLPGRVRLLLPPPRRLFWPWRHLPV